MNNYINFFLDTFMLIIYFLVFSYFTFTKKYSKSTSIIFSGLVYILLQLFSAYIGGSGVFTPYGLGSAYLKSKINMSTALQFLTIQIVLFFVIVTYMKSQIYIEEKTSLKYLR